MLIALIAKDKADSLAVRQENRPAHVEYLKSTGCVSQAGPLLDADAQMCGSLVILDVADMAAAQDWAANDPYAKAGLFADVQLIAWNKVIG
ncbi:YciI family protein [Sulfitobacter sp.]|uniref:YciI family protein n=1 Tax=Sulfitobacter sp. TaxID=1903071 RepID=UPI0035698403